MVKQLYYFSKGRNIAFNYIIIELIIYNIFSSIIETYYSKKSNSPSFNNK